MKNKSINIYGGKIWKPEYHKKYSCEFQQRIFVFLLCLKKIHNEISIKIPRFVVYEIIKFCI